MSSIALRALRFAPISVKYAIRPVPVMAVRAFTSPSSPVRKDLVQDIYIKQIKSYKPAPEEKGAEQGQVKELHIPAAPQPPQIESDLTADLQAYQQEDPVAVTASEEDQAVQEDEYTDILEEALKDEEEETEGEH
ncbi:uncharacterized protein VTP21DRAFT_4746 [Calcarisporiella thermophila]|uniref:uncharacterized protein n=1 Tax=Calcarisporiella thermophila TaxID=911321 RepID=UPI0037448195